MASVHEVLEPAALAAALAGGRHPAAMAEELDEGAPQDFARVHPGALPAVPKDPALAASLKAEGNALFGAGDFAGAAERYAGAIRAAPRGAPGSDAEQQRAVFHANRAACRVHLGDLEGALADCDAAIAARPEYVKAVLRRSQVRERLDKPHDALEDVKRVLELDAGNAAARAALPRLEREVHERNEKMKDEMLGKLKDLGNGLLGRFGLSTDNFKFEQDPATGSYNVSFSQ